MTELSEQQNDESTYKRLSSSSLRMHDQNQSLYGAIEAIDALNYSTDKPNSTSPNAMVNTRGNGEVTSGLMDSIRENKLRLPSNADGPEHEQETKTQLSILEGLQQALEGNGKSPIISTLPNMLAGCGVVGLPITYAYSGLFTGIIIMILIAGLSVYTLRMLIVTGKKNKCQDYERLVSKCFGIKGYYFISFNLLIFDIGACLTYTIILGNSAKAVMEYIFKLENDPTTANIYRQIFITIIYICLILPFCLGRDFSFIEKVSAAAIFVVFIMIGIVIYMYYDEYRDASKTDPNYSIEYWLNQDNYFAILASIGTITFAFIQHDLCFMVYKTLKNNTIKRYTILAFLGMLIQCILCVVICIYGYLSFGDNVEDDLLLNFDIENRAIIAIRILYTFRMSFCFPTAFYVVRHILYSIVYRDGDTYEHASKLKRIIFTLIPLLSFLIIGLFLQDLGFVMSLAGLLSALNLAFVLPSLCHIKKGTPYPLKFWKAKDGKIWDAFIDIVPPLILIIFGTFAATVGSIELILTTLLGRDV